MSHSPDTVLILDFGSQYTQLIARRIREFNVLATIQPWNRPVEARPELRGIILSGSPFSVNQAQAPQPDLDQLQALNLPILGICYGAQWVASRLGGQVASSAVREYGASVLEPLNGCPLFAQVPAGSVAWMSHSDSILTLPATLKPVARTDSIPVAAWQHESLPLFGLQFHPEVTHSQHGALVLRSFVLEVCRAQPNWTPRQFIDQSIDDIHQHVGDAHVLMALSGGVDSSVAAALLQAAIGPRLHAVFVDTGMLRLHEYEEVMAAYANLGMDVLGVKAGERFLAELKGVTEPEQKRKIIGRLFVDVFQENAGRWPDVRFLGQGTIYPDVIESVSVNGPSAVIKSHHNVGGLPERMHLQVVEPLRMLFKDEVRKTGLALGLPERMVMRHPFPGPGLAIRILGEVTPENVRILQQADRIFIDALHEMGLYSSTWQAFAVLLPVHSVGVMGDERTYERVLALRAVTSTDGMTADWARLPHDALAEISSRIINQVKGINRVVYDISSKPPATIEWE